MKAMCANINKRYSTATEMLEDLESFRKNPNLDLEYIREELTEQEDTEPTRYISKKEIHEAVQGKKEAAVKEEKPEKTGIAGTKNEKKRMAILIGSFAAALLAIFLIFTLIFDGFGGGGEKDGYKVPNILGMTVEQAENMSEIKGIFSIEVVGTKESSKYTEGQIISQDPTEGTMRKNNLTIQVYVCAKEEKAFMPTVTGSSESDAKELLSNMNMNLSVQVQPKSSDTVEKGLVISTSPEAGSQIKKGNTVILYISTGREIKPVTVINFVGMTEEKAKTEAEKLGLVVGASSSEYSDEPAGTVIRQSISVSTEAKTGDNIYFTVSKGPENKEIDVPNVVGASENAARKLLESYGFQVEVQWENGEKVDNAVVKSYSPKGSAESGSTVTIVLGTASQGPGTSDHTDDMGN